MGATTEVQKADDIFNNYFVYYFGDMYSLGIPIGRQSSFPLSKPVNQLRSADTIPRLALFERFKQSI